MHEAAHEGAALAGISGEHLIGIRAGEAPAPAPIRLGASIEPGEMMQGLGVVLVGPREDRPGRERDGVDLGLRAGQRRLDARGGAQRARRAQGLEILAVVGRGGVGQAGDARGQPGAAAA